MASERKIGRAIYRFEPLVGWPAFEALGLLLKVAGPFMPLLEAIGEKDDDARTVALVRALPEVLAKHDADALKALLGVLMESCTVDGAPCVVGVRPHDLNELFEVGAFALEGQFVPFFGGSGVGRLKALAQV